MIPIHDLLANAVDRFQTIQLELSAEYDTSALSRAMERSIPDFDERVAEGSIARLELADTRGRSAARHERFRHTWRVWWRKPSCWRDDIIWENGATARHMVWQDESMAYVSAARTQYTNQGDTGWRERLSSIGQATEHYELPTVANRSGQIPVVNPSVFAVGWELSVRDPAIHGGRKAVRVEATRTPQGDPPALWDFLDRYDMLVDVERGILLRYAAIIDGAEAGVLAVRSVVFDAAIPDEVFREPPPAGTKIVRV